MPNFRPDTGGRRWTLIQVASSRAAGRGRAAFPSALLRLPAALYGACPALCAVPALGCSTKARNKKLACFLCLPCPSRSGSQELDGRSLPGCDAPSPLRVPSPSPHPCHWSGACDVVSVILSPVLSVRVILSRIVKFLSLESDFRAIYFQYSHSTLLHLCISIFSSFSRPCFAFLRLFFKGIIKNMLFLQKGIFLMVLIKSIQRNSP